MNIVPQEHWDNGYNNFSINKASEKDPITQLIKKYIPHAKPNEQAFEIGCFPGRFLCILGDLGYILNGVDTTPHINGFQSSLDSLGYKTNKIENKNFEDIERKKYEVVASFGFIEHFTNWDEVIQTHIEFLNKNGYLIITTPNFKGLFQYLYHRIVDNDNLKRHIITSMSPKKWKTQLELAGLEVISMGYIGNEFWDESKKRNLFYHGIRKITSILFNIMNQIMPGHSSIGAYCYIIAKNK